MESIANDIIMSAQTSLVDHNQESIEELRPKFLVNDYYKGN